MIHLIKRTFTAVIILFSPAVCFDDLPPIIPDTPLASCDTPKKYYAQISPSSNTTELVTQPPRQPPYPSQAPHKNYREIRPRFPPISTPNFTHPIESNPLTFIDYTLPITPHTSTRVQTPFLAGAKRPIPRFHISSRPAAKKQKISNSKYAGINFKAVKCWRVHPDKIEYFELLDTQGRTVYSAPVRVNNKTRILSRQCFYICNKRLKRHPLDTADLEKHGFAPDQTPHIYKGPDIPFFVNGIDMTPANTASSLKVSNETFDHRIDITEATDKANISSLEAFLDDPNSFPFNEDFNAIDFSWLEKYN